MSCIPHSSLTNSSRDAVSVICEMVRQHLGVNESVRCIVAGDGVNEVYVKDTVETLKHLDLQHPAAVHVVRVCSGHKNLYGCGGKSLLFLIGQLTSQLHSLVQQGIPLLYLEELLFEALDYCKDHLQSLTVPVSVFPAVHAGINHSEKSCSQDTSPVPVIINSCGTINATVISKHPCPSAQSVRHKLQSGHSFVRETGGATAGALGHGGVNDGHGMMIENYKPSYAESCHQSCSVQKPKNIVGSVNLSSPNSFLQGHTNSPSSASKHTNVILRSRHLWFDDSAGKQKDSLCRPSNDSHFSIRKQDSCKKTEDVSLEQGLYRSMCNAGSSVHQLFIHKQPDSFPKSTKDGLGCGPAPTAKKVFVSLPTEAQSLSHGYHEMMSWAEEAMHRHLQHSKDLRFDASLIHTVCVGGGSGRHQLVEGLVLSASQDMMELVTRSTGHTSMLLMKGDVTARFRHIGYRSTLPSTRLTGTVESLQHHRSQHTWHCQVLALLRQLSVGVVLVRGTVDSDLCGACTAAGIALIQHVPFPALKVLEAVCRVDILTYILDAHEGNLCQGVSLKALREDWCDTTDPGCKHLVITPPVFVQTLVLSEPSRAGREIKEEEFRHCVARLAQAAEDGQVLQGGAATEHWCARLLLTEQHLTQKDSVIQRGRWAGEMALYRPVVRAALAEAFLSFSRTVQINRQRADWDTNSVQGIHTAQHIQSSLRKSASPHPCQNCQRVSEDAPSHESRQSVMSEVCKKCTAASMCMYACESMNKMEASHSISLSDHHACRAELSTKTGYPSHPVWQDTDADPDLRYTNSALNSRNSSELHQVSFCVPSQTGITADEGLCKVASHHQLLLRANASEQDCAGPAVWDNYSSKVNGWRSALQCACAVMRMDEAITTGIDRHTLPPNSVLL